MPPTTTCPGSSARFRRRCSGQSTRRPTITTRDGRAWGGHRRHQGLKARHRAAALKVVAENHLLSASASYIDRPEQAKWSPASVAIWLLMRQAKVKEAQTMGNKYYVARDDGETTRPFEGRSRSCSSASEQLAEDGRGHSGVQPACSAAANMVPTPW